MQDLQETPVLESLFKKVETLLKKDPNTGVFLRISRNFKDYLFSKVICRRLHFQCFNVSLLHGQPKGSRSRFYDSVRLQVSGHRSSFFVFNSTSLVLNRVPTYVRTPKRNTFDESIKFWHLLFLVILDGFRLHMVLDRFRSFKIVLDCFSLFLTLVSTVPKH